ncbi:hypothetical protein JCGZ_16000 [Jatropha curcas]|uniref:BSD domain-containing protein n=1 Tax=Jatropha curcas TaxID=180498 RepID=A0A067L2Y4_JATCU|nr:uncharacterized protein LOC105630818 [Jatropha curcas]KDP41593.1 hypothetical protein JCGZ_16000 [Jatropha curcas]
MSWLARSLANSLRLDDDDDSAEHDVAPYTPHDFSPVKRYGEDAQSTEGAERRKQVEEEAQARGVKEDLTELKQTLTRQLWGVASFLAPPPTFNDRSVSNLNQSEPSDRSEEGGHSDSEELEGIRQDFAEIGGRFRSGVTGISKAASNYFPFGSEENEVENNVEGNEGEGEELEMEERDDWGAGAIGITDEVLAFARNIAMHPETWLDFPLDEEDDLDDFDMSSAQQEHAMAIERLAPRLAALRIELCPCHMTDSYFWKVYFVLLHSRLNKHDAEVLSTPQVMEARAMWMKELHKQTKPDTDWFGRSTSYVNESALSREDFEYARTFDFEPTSSMATDYGTEKHPIVSPETECIDKSIIKEKAVIKIEDKGQLAGQSSNSVVPNYEDDGDDWPDEDGSDLGSYRATFPLGNEEDISFSDLEDDIDNSICMKSKILQKDTETSTS